MDDQRNRPVEQPEKQILTGLSVQEFSEVLSSRAPVPGGGGAAAVTGALGASLCAMAGNLTLGRKKYADAEPDIRRMLGQLDLLRSELLSLVQEDAEAFEPLSKAYAIPKTDPDRDRKLEEATMTALDPPLRMLRCLSEAVPLLLEMREKGSVMLLSDVACGASLCAAAMESAAINVYVNTRTLLNREKAREINAEADAVLREDLPVLRKLVQEVTGELRQD